MASDTPISLVAQMKISDAVEISKWSQHGQSPILKFVFLSSSPLFLEPASVQWEFWKGVCAQPFVILC